MYISLQHFKVLSLFYLFLSMFITDTLEVTVREKSGPYLFEEKKLEHEELTA